MNKITISFLGLLSLFTLSGNAQEIHKTYSELFEGAIEDLFVVDSITVIAGGDYFDETAKKIHLNDEDRINTLFEYKTGDIIYNSSDQVLAGVPSSDFSQSIHIVTPEGRVISEVPNQSHVAFSGDGSLLFTADFAHIYAREWKSGEIIDSLKWDGQINSIIPLNQKQLLIEEGDEKKSIYVWDYKKNDQPHLVYSTQSTIRKIVPSANYMLVAENTEEKDYYHRVKINLLNYEGIVLYEWIEEDDIEKMTLSKDGSLLGITNRFDEVKLWHKEKEGHKFKEMDGFPERLDAIEILFIDNGSYLLLSSYFELSFFNIADMAVKEVIQLNDDFTFTGSIKAVPGTRYFVAAFEDAENRGGLFKIYFNDEENKNEHKVDNKASGTDAAVVLQSGHLDKISSMVFAGNRTLFSGDESGRLIKWVLKSGLHFEPVSMFENDEVYGSYSSENPLMLAYNANLDHLAVAADNNRTLAILNGSTMQQEFSLSANSPASHPAYSLDGEFLVFAEDGFVKILRADRNGYKLQHSVTIDASINSIKFLKDDTLIGVADVTGTIHLIEAESGSVVNRLSSHEGGIIDVDYVAGSNWLYAVDFNSNIYKWNLETFDKQVFYKSTYSDGNFMESGADSVLTIHLQVNGIELGRDGNFLYSFGNSYKSVGGKPVYSILIWDTKTGERVGNFEIDEPSDIISYLTISSDGNMLSTGGWDQKIRLWDINNRRLQKSFGNPIPKIEDAIAYKDNHIVLSTISSSEDYYRLQKWDLADLNIDISLDGVAYGTDNLLLDRNRMLVGTTFANQFRWVSFENPEDSLASFIPEKYYSHSHATPDMGLMFAYSVTNKKGEADYNPLKNIHIDVYDTEREKKVYTIETDGYLNFVEPYSTLQPRFNAKKNLYAIQSGRNSISLFDYKSGELEEIIETEQLIINAWFSAENLFIWQNNRIIKVDLDDFSTRVIHSFDDPVYDPNKNLAAAMAVSNNTQLAWVSELKEPVKTGRTRTFILSLYNEQQQKRQTAILPIIPKYIFFINRGRELAVVFKNYIALFSTNDGNLIGSMVPVKKNEYFFYTPDFFYASSRDAYQAVGFQFQNQMVSFDQLDLWYNRPDIVMDRLGLADQNRVDVTYEAYRKRVSQAGLKSDSLPDMSNWPTIQLEENISMTSKKDHIRFDIQAADTTGGLSSLHVYANGVPVWGQQGKTISGINYQQTVDVDLIPGNNKIQVSVRNTAGFESIRKTIEVQYKPDKTVKPDLYLFSINVSNYQSDNDLEYARKDGEDLVNLFRQNHDSTFSDIYIDTLYDDKAKIENILALKEKLQQTNVEDQVILFISGHGLLDDNFDFYFATYDTDFENPSERGISYEQIEGLLDGIPARRKLMLIDACHSGEIDQSGFTDTDVPLAENVTTVYEGAKGVETLGGSDLGLENSFTLMQNLFTNLNRGSGSVVISAAAGDSYALESDEWRNGVFTYSILDGLKNMNADLNNDKKVTVSELRDYAYKKVVSETGGRQQPTTRQENLEFDFRIW